MNKGGKAVAPTIESFSAAAARANWEGTPGFGVIITNEPGAASWPIAGATFILIHKQPSDPAAAGAALKFFNWAYAKGGKMAEELDYVAGQRRQRGSAALGRPGQGCKRQAALRSSQVIPPTSFPRLLAARTGADRVRPRAISASIHKGLGCHPTVME